MYKYRPTEKIQGQGVSYLFYLPFLSPTVAISKSHNDIITEPSTFLSDLQDERQEEEIFAEPVVHVRLRPLRWGGPAGDTRLKETKTSKLRVSHFVMLLLAIYMYRPD